MKKSKNPHETHCPFEYFVIFLEKKCEQKVSKFVDFVFRGTLKKNFEIFLYIGFWKIELAIILVFLSVPKARVEMDSAKMKYFGSKNFFQTQNPNMQLKIFSHTQNPKTPNPQKIRHGYTQN